MALLLRPAPVALFLLTRGTQLSFSAAKPVWTGGHVIPAVDQRLQNHLVSFLSSQAGRLLQADRERGSASTIMHDLPVWDLSAFGYASWKDPKILQDVGLLESIAEEFSSKYRGELATKLYESILDYAKIAELRMKIDSYTRMNTDVDQKNADLVKFKTSIYGRLSECEAKYLAFYTLELADLSEKQLEAQMTPELEFYSPFIRDQRKSKPYLLSENVESALALRAPWVGPSPVVDFYLKQVSLATFKWEGQDVNLEKMLAYLQSPDASLRRRALKEINDGLGRQSCNKFAALSLNVVAGSQHIENKARGYKRLRSSTNLMNNVPDSVVDSLLTAIKERGVQLSSRYYRLKKYVLAKTQGLEEFTWADRIAPLALEAGEQKYTWDEAVKIVGEAFQKFSSTIASLFMQQIKERRLHAPPLPFKVSGAYCDGVVPDIGPFQLHNYIGTPRDVSTLAHESGHAAHFMLSGGQGVLQFQPPSTLAEVASLFGEMIVFRWLLSNASSKEERLAMLMEKIDTILSSVVRQCAFDRFEELVHTARGQGIIDEAEFDEFWMQVTKEYYGQEGEAFDKYEDMNYLWCYVQHFHQSPFYVYSYAFADLIVGALHSVYVKHPESFEPKLLELLQAGGSRTFVEVLKPFDLKPDNPEFWTESLNVHLLPLLEEAEALVQDLYK